MLSDEKKEPIKTYSFVGWILLMSCLPQAYCGVRVLMYGHFPDNLLGQIALVHQKLLNLFFVCGSLLQNVLASTPFNLLAAYLIYFYWRILFGDWQVLFIQKHKFPDFTADFWGKLRSITKSCGHSRTSYFWWLSPPVRWPRCLSRHQLGWTALHLRPSSGHNGS